VLTVRIVCGVTLFSAICTLILLALQWKRNNVQTRNFFKSLVWVAALDATNSIIYMFSSFFRQPDAWYCNLEAYLGGSMELASVFISVCLAMSIDKYVRARALEEKQSLLESDSGPHKPSLIERIEDVKNAEIIYPLVSFVFSGAIATIPFIWNAYGDSGFIWCWIRNDLEPWKHSFLLLITLYGWVTVSWVLIFALSVRIARSPSKRYLIFLGVFIAVWFPPTIQRISSIFIDTPFWLEFLHTLTNNLKGTLNFTVVVIMLYGSKISSSMARVAYRDQDYWSLQ